jgi:hypothetical protein
MLTAFTWTRSAVALPDHGLTAAEATGAVTTKALQVAATSAAVLSSAEGLARWPLRITFS